MKKAALLFVGLSSPIMLLALVRGGPLAEAVFALLAAVFPVALIALGAARGARSGVPAALLGVLVLLLAGSMAGMLLLRGMVDDGPWIGGLPAAAALQIFGLFLLPLLVVSVGFALTFPDSGTAGDTLERLRRRAGRPAPGAGD